MQADVAIIGAGPAGLAAAARLGQLGVGRIVVIEREAEPGGIPRHCGHSPFGMREFHRVLGGQAYAARLAAMARVAGAEILCATTAVALHPGPALDLATPDGMARLTARAVLVATGTREASRVQRMIGGQKPGGILTTGALQALVYSPGWHADLRPVLRPVVLGTELVSFSALLTCRKAGIRPVAMIGQGPAVVARAPFGMASHMMRVPRLLATQIITILGRDRVTAVVVEGPEGTREIATDGVLLTGDFRSETALLAAAGMALDARSTGPVIDSFGQLDQPGYFAAGNLLRPIETAGACWSEGRVTADAIAAYLAGRLPEAAPGLPVQIASDAIRYAVPQIVQSGASAHDSLQLRLLRPARGELRLMQDGRVISRRRVASGPERRLTLPVPPVLGPAPLILTLEETG